MFQLPGDGKEKKPSYSSPFNTPIKPAAALRNQGRRFSLPGAGSATHGRAKLVDMRLEEIIDKETYEQKYFDLSSQIEQLQKQRESLQESAETESTMKKRIAEFRRTLEENEVLDTFDRYVFESIVEKVIVGGYDEDGNKDPAMLTFIYKTGFKNSLDGTNFKPPRKNSKAAKQNAGLCSHTTDEAKSMCSYHSDDTR